MYPVLWGFPGGSDSEESAWNAGRFDPWVGKVPCRRKWQPTLVFLPGEFHAQSSLNEYSPQGHKELDMTEKLTHTPTVSVWATREAPYQQYKLPNWEPSMVKLTNGWSAKAAVITQQVPTELEHWGRWSDGETRLRFRLSHPRPASAPRQMVWGRWSGGESRHRFRL